MNKTFLALPKSLSTKIFLLLIVTMVCIGALFNIVLISIQKKTYTSSHDAHGATLIRLLAHSISLAVVTENKDEMYASVSGLLQQDDVFEVVIWNKDGEMLLQKTKNPAKRLRIIGNPMKMLMIFRQHDKSDYQSMETKDSFILWGQIFLMQRQARKKIGILRKRRRVQHKRLLAMRQLFFPKNSLKKVYAISLFRQASQS